jgi:hypothetical protein
VFRPSDSVFYLKDTNSQGTADVSFAFGDSSWVPIAGRWGAVDAIPPLSLEVVATGMDQPVFLDAPVGDGRIFVAEKGGRIRIIDGGSVLSTPYLALTNISTAGERGLLGLAFHPDFADNGRFFVHFSDSVGTTNVVEYHADPSSNVADPSPIRTILTVPQPATNHNGGMIEFGPDGYLYVSLGDGGGSPGNRPQDTGNVLGSILRLDVDGVTPGAAAPGNPYAAGPGDDRIWAIGLRNPWRTAIDAESGTMIIADVGQDRREEVNVVPLASAPRNYGWPIMEGSLCYPSGTGCQTSGLTLPVVEYGRDEGRSITGGYVYRGGAMPGLAGRYFYGDFITGFIRSFAVTSGGASNGLDHTWELGRVGGLVSFGTDGHGELYVVSIGGTISRMATAP